MIISFRCSNYNDFIKFMKEQFHDIETINSIVAGFNGLYEREGHYPNQESLQGIGSLAYKMMMNKTWLEIAHSENEFYEKNGYIDIEYDSELKKAYAKKRDKGRPDSLNSKKNNITFRLTNDELRELDNYCNTYNVERSEVVRGAIRLLIDKK